MGLKKEIELAIRWSRRERHSLTPGQGEKYGMGNIKKETDTKTTCIYTYSTSLIYM